MVTLEKQLDQRNKLLEERNEQVSVLTSAIVDLRDEVLRLRKQWDNAQVRSAIVSAMVAGQGVKFLLRCVRCTVICLS